MRPTAIMHRLAAGLPRSPRPRLTPSVQSSSRINFVSGRSSSSEVARQTASPQSASVDWSRSVPSRPFVLVYGGNGSLGQAMISSFRAADWRTISVDYYENSGAEHNILLSHSNDWRTNTEAVASSLQQLGASLSDDQQEAARSLSTSPSTSWPYLSAVISVAGGWKGSTVSSPALFESTDVMLQCNVLSSLSSAHIASHFLLPESLLLLTGAAAAASPSGTPSMIGYGMAKAAVHHLTLSLSAHDSELTQRGTRVACLLPVTIDTPQNREVMRAADYADWTPVSEFARAALRWAEETQPARRQNRGEARSAKAKSSQEEEVADGKVGDARRVRHMEGGARGAAAVPPLAHGGFYEFRTSKHATTVQLIDDPLALGRVVAQ